MLPTAICVMTEKSLEFALSFGKLLGSRPLRSQLFIV